MFSTPATMQKLLCTVCAVVSLATVISGQYFGYPIPAAAPPPPGFAVYPHPQILKYNTTFNNTQNGPCKSNANNSTGSHNLFIGCVSNNDKLLFVQQFVKPGRWWSSREKTIEFPGTVPSGFMVKQTITGIRVYDNKFDSTGGFCSIISGGVGQSYVRLRMYSKSAGKGFDFTVKIYGH